MPEPLCWSALVQGGWAATDEMGLYIPSETTSVLCRVEGQAAAGEMARLKRIRGEEKAAPSSLGSLTEPPLLKCRSDWRLISDWRPVTLAGGSCVGHFRVMM